MKNDDWMDAHTACDILGVKAQTLYAYVSRHKIRTTADPNDSRHSLYARHDIEGLLARMRRPRARADVAKAAIRWGDPVLTTAISEVRDGTIWLRGRSIQECASHLTFEQVAALLWDVPEVVCPPVGEVSDGRSPFSRAIGTLAKEIETASPMRGRDLAEICRDAERMIAMITDACLGCRLSGPIHERISAAWGAKPDAVDVIRRALVLLSDHELNPSTFAVRVCASTGASLPATLLAGMSTLSGPGHGGVTDFAKAAVRAAKGGKLNQLFAETANLTPYAFGFGHPLYSAGDPRAVALLNHIPRDAPARRAVDVLSKRLSLPPNIDAALAATVDYHGLPDDAAATLFSVGRSAGWIAHAIEQVRSGEMIRPRATFQTHPNAT